jgi:hypothetical protein
MTKTKPLFKYLSLASIAILAACGGGGDDGGSSTPPASYWTLDAHTFVNGGNSAVTTNLTGPRPLTVAAVSTATLEGGDKSNGAYSGSSISFSFAGTTAGVYQVTADKRALLNTSDLTTRPIVVESNVGIAVTTGSTLYRASAGQVQVTIDSAGKYHFDSVGPITTDKTLDVNGGVIGAPASMALVIHDAF